MSSADLWFGWVIGRMGETATECQWLQDCERQQLHCEGNSYKPSTVLLVWEWARAVDLAGLVAAKREQLAAKYDQRMVCRGDGSRSGVRLGNKGGVAQPAARTVCR